ncbi:hypothetical protein ACIBCA_36450 [Kitasatospora sp. NPDC051170]|uniref:hypothetical protein n=1 Tax=Kitasatospora sp. NPDC051170 TaxID=3364056 RepID=UPI0037B48E76
MNSILHVLKLHPQRMTATDIVDRVASHDFDLLDTSEVSAVESAIELQGQYEEQVIALVIRDLTSADPAATVWAVNTVVAQVWKQAAEHVEKAATTWTHISWFVQNAVTEFIDGLRPQMAGC